MSGYPTGAGGATMKHENAWTGYVIWGLLVLVEILVATWLAVVILQAAKL
jgi:hypothetical protein